VVGGPGGMPGLKRREVLRQYSNGVALEISRNKIKHGMFIINIHKTLWSE
jgi:hypothetical protein